MKKNKNILSLMIFLLLMVSEVSGKELDPQETLQGVLNRFEKVFRDPALAGEEKWPTRRSFIINETKVIFDFPEMAKRSLAKEWRNINSDQQDYFTKILGELLTKTYVERLKDYTLVGNSTDRIIFGKKLERDKKAVVNTLVILTGKEIPVAYKMVKKDRHWRVYDVIIEGVSLIRNYRSQFAQVVRTDGYKELVGKIEEKISSEVKNEFE